MLVWRECPWRRCSNLFDQNENSSTPFEHNAAAREANTKGPGKTRTSEVIGYLAENIFVTKTNISLI